uniref:Beta'-coat protein n=1 Tax=Panagrellus redivivus TaxID=6233 RepID=A0A7E4ZR94_PANRE
MKVDIQRKLLCRSDRVKCVDLHPTEPWLLTALYSGQVHIWHTTEATLIKSFEVSSSPIRVGKFIARKSWIVTGSDDLHVRIFNYNTTVKIADFEAHDDFIRSALVHPILNVFITASDDTFIKVWDWDKNFECVERFEGHTNFIMQVTLNPKDNSIFASASLDKTVKVWQIGNKVANFTLVGHEQGVNCVDFYPGDGRPYLASGSDDWQIRIWDYLARSCVSVLKGHSNNVNAVIFAARGLPLLYSGSEDDTIKAWNVNSFKCESTVTFGLGRCWTASTLPKRNSIAVGFDEGSAVLAIGNEEPLVSMDDSGKVVRAQGVDVYKAILNLADAPEVDEAPLKLEWTHITTAELYPQKMEHSPNGRFVAVSGDDEWMICTASAFRNKAFGHGKEFAWAAASVGSNVFGVVDGQSSVRIYRNFNEDTFIKTEFPIKGIDGGPFLTVRSANFVSFYDWSGELIENVEFSAVKVYWNEDGTKVAVAGKSTFFILNYNTDSDDTQFTPSNPYPETVTSALWIEGCFVFTTSANSIQYIVSGDKQTVAHFDRAVLLVRFFPKSELLALTDFEGNVYIRTLPLSLIRYQLAVEASDFDHADALLASIPNEYRAKLGRYLEKLGFKKQALAVSDDQEHRFELAIGLNLLNTRDKVFEQGGTIKYRNDDSGMACGRDGNDKMTKVLNGAPLGDVAVVAVAGQHTLRGIRSLDLLTPEFSDGFFVTKLAPSCDWLFAASEGVVKCV